MCPPRGDGRAPRRRFLVEAVDPDSEGFRADRAPQLLAEELPHALKVLRLKVGDVLDGMDGCGRTWPLVVSAAGRHSLDLEIQGDPETSPPPGAPGASLPAIEVAVAFPRPSLAEEMVGRLTQLGVARIRPLITERSTPGASDPKHAKLERVAREACKQSGRAWFPAILEPMDLTAWLAGLNVPATHLDASGGTRVADWAEGRGGSSEMALAVGPEGGWSDPERDALHRAGVGATRLAPHILRTETAAEAAAAILVQCVMRDA